MSIGLAHVDVLDFHAERLPDQPARDVSRIETALLAERYARATDSGAGWHRWSLYWDLVERHGTYSFAAADGIVGRDHAAGLRSLVILQGIPAQYGLEGLGGLGAPDATVVSGSHGAWGAAGAVAGLHLATFRDAAGTPTDDPLLAAEVNTDNPWAAFVNAAVQRYRPGGSFARERGLAEAAGVRAWEIGNEPNLSHFWRGSPADYARFLEVASLVIRWRDPAATIVHAGIADDGNAEVWYRAFLSALRLRAASSPLPERYGYYFDKAGWHFYSSPEKLRTGVGKARALLAEAGIPEKPIWVTEFGLPVWSEHPGPCWDPVSPRRGTLTEQSAYLWQAAAEALAAGVENLIWFQLYDDCGNGSASYDAFGLVRNLQASQCWTDPEHHACWVARPELLGQPRGAFTAFKTFARQMLGARPIGADRSEGAVKLVFSRPPSTRVVVAWATGRTGTSVGWDAAGPGIIYGLDERGNVTERTTPGTGAAGIALAGATNRNAPGGGALLGGPPVLIVESDSSGPIATVASLPELSEQVFSVKVALSDAGLGIAAYRVFFSIVRPQSVHDWLELTPPTEWHGPANGGTVDIPFAGLPGGSYFFAALARDRAGNWSPLPVAPQAWTKVAMPAPTIPPQLVALALRSAVIHASRVYY